MNQNIKSLTQSENNDELYNEYITNVPTENNNNNNNTINYNINSLQEENSRNSNPQNINVNISNNHNKSNINNSNYAKLLKMYDDEKKKSMELQKEINSIRTQIESKNQENKDLNNKITLLIQKTEEINQENNMLYENNDIFYQNFVSILNNYEINQNLVNIQLPNFSVEDEQDKKNQDMLYTLEVLLNVIVDMMNNTNNNYSKFNELKDKINLVNKRYMANTKEKNNEVNGLKRQLKKMKNILDQNMEYLNEIREENNILKQRNLNLEKNLNIISKSNEGFRNNKYLLEKVYCNDINSDINDDIETNYLNNNNNINYINNNLNMNRKSGTSINTQKTNNDLLMEEFYDKENKIKSLHNMANKMLSNIKKGKIISKNESKFNYDGNNIKENYNNYMLNVNNEDNIINENINYNLGFNNNYK
jgi:hypothetical protein